MYNKLIIVADSFHIVFWRNSVEMVCPSLQSIEESTALSSLGLASISVSFFQRPHRFFLRVRVIGKQSALKTVAFAAETEEELAIWKDLSSHLLVRVLIW